MEKNEVQKSIEGSELFADVKMSSVENARKFVEQYLNKGQEKEGENK